MDDIALGATVFKRAEKVATLLQSASAIQGIQRVYIADNGEITDRKDEIYSADYPFELEVLDLEYDSGLGYGREQIVKESEEPYLLVVDNDVEIPHNVDQLWSILNEREELGGVGGVLIEGNQLRSQCFDLHEWGSLLVKDIRGGTAVERVKDLPLVTFDLIQNVAMYRRECLEDYCWDPAYKIGWEHTDFFVGHKHESEWTFGVCPEVQFRHHPGGDESYMDDRRNYERIRASKNHFLNKWGYDQVMNGQIHWLETHTGRPRPGYLVSELGKAGLFQLPPGVLAPLMNLRDRIRKARGKPPF